MDSEFLKSLINTVVFLLPVMGLIWKGAKLTTRFETLEKNVQEKTEKFCKDHRNMEEKIEEERKATDMAISTLMATITEIQKSLVRIETKLDIEEHKNK